MRLLIAALLFALPGRADAQPSGAGAPSSPAPALSAIGLPLPPIGLPLPTIGLPPHDLTPTLTPAVAPRRGTPRGAGGQRRGRGRAPVVYVVPGYAWSTSATGSTPGAPTAAAPEEPAGLTPTRLPTGTLRIDLQPPVAAGQVFVDGAYAGTLDDLRGELTLDAGRHDLEIRHPGYEALGLAVRIDGGRAITYRGTLQPEVPTPDVAPSKPAGPPPIERKPLFYIPGCYLGDVPPKDAALPASCDLSRTVTFRP